MQYTTTRDNINHQFQIEEHQTGGELIYLVTVLHPAGFAEANNLAQPFTLRYHPDYDRLYIDNARDVTNLEWLEQTLSDYIIGVNM